MNGYSIRIEPVGDEDYRQEVYYDVLKSLIKNCLSEDSQNEQSDYLFKSLD